MIQDKMIAMLLAGGQGSRLKELTRRVAKPAVSFGGKYRIIDFALSNATNSGIDDIAILTQYKPYELNSHLGIGSPWDYDRNNGGLRILTPFTSEDGGVWFTGTANAIYENMDYIEAQDPEYVLVLSGDHIYKMNYNEMLQAHKAHGASCTIAVMEVPWEEASRFGIINCDGNDRIVEFDEKPANPKSNMASMGIYIFNRAELKKYLIEDEKNPDSENDFGKNVLPLFLENDELMYVWKFNGYWKDVGTVKSYWEGHMDLLNPDNDLNLYDRDWRIYTNNLNLPPQYIADGAHVINSMANEGCLIYGDLIHSIASSSAVVEKGAIVENSVLLPNSKVMSGAKVKNAVVMSDVVIGEDEVIGSDNGVYLVTESGIIEE